MGRRRCLVAGACLLWSRGTLPVPPPQRNLQSLPGTGTGTGTGAAHRARRSSPIRRPASPAEYPGRTDYAASDPGLPPSGETLPTLGVVDHFDRFPGAADFAPLVGDCAANGAAWALRDTPTWMPRDKWTLPNEQLMPSTAVMSMACSPSSRPPTSSGTARPSGLSVATRIADGRASNGSTATGAKTGRSSRTSLKNSAISATGCLCWVGSRDA
jgi:hypothetical protein